MASISTIEEIVDWIIGTAEHTAEQGDRFERLMLQFFRHAPAWADQFDDVWLWSEWPGNESDADHGIDLVAKNAGEDTYTAIQAKCYQRTTTLNKPDIDSFISASGREHFTRRILVSTTYNIGAKAQKEMDGQTIPVQLVTLDGLRDSGINWADWSPDNFTIERADPKTPKPHQQEALDAVINGLAEADRGKAIMACGTGKTYTAQLIAEKAVGAGGLVLVLAPSISLVSQTISSWYADTTIPMSVFGVCSDTTAGKRGDNADISPYDLVIPPTTDPEVLAANVAKAPAGHMKVIFSTYQSSERIGQAQELGLGKFDLIICDEAHRTTGVQLESEDTKPFQFVHDNENIDAKKRLYMTATPRVYKPSQKIKASEKDALVASMDDVATYGETFHTLTFRDAVNLGELTDYKVLILTIEETAVNEAFQRHTADLGEVNLPEAAQMVGCLNALAKKERVRNEGDIRAFDDGDIVPLQRAVAFSNTIKASTHFADEFARIAADYQHVTGVGVGERLKIETDHVDGKQNTVQRNKKLDWLRDQPGEHICRVLSNAKCLTEGIDVPTLDAVLFLEPRKSHVDIIQAVGRVMRTAPGKEYGYIVIPIAVPPGTPPEAVLKDGRFKTVWQVLSALRSHDPDMNRDVSQIRFGKKPRNIDFDHIPGDQEIDDNADPATEDENGDPVATAIQGELEFDIEQFQELCWASMVQKVGDTHYLTKWAHSVADIAAALEERIRTLSKEPGVTRKFGQFVKALQANLNAGVDADAAIAMLAQHIVTRPVFDAIFPNYSLLASNPIAQAMEDMLTTLEDRQNLVSETKELDGFYDQVAYSVDGITEPTERQKVLIELYEEFFKAAFPKQAESLGIVYTPIEVTDFIINAADAALKKHFDGTSLSDEGVHILDPFTGTGTFIVQMLRSGLINPHDLARKFITEIHANEIQLLAYYIAAVNIETAYHALAGGDGSGPIQAFPGIVYTDTFQTTETGDGASFDLFNSNSSRAAKQRELPIRVIVGNPPYSAGQSTANDNNANLAYPLLNKRIGETYAARSTATNKNSLYDSYIRAIRWATDRIHENSAGGVVAYVSNGGYIDGNTADGVRLTIAEEFHQIYVFNLRGNQRTAGERSRREGGKIFGAGSRASVAIIIAVKEAGPIPHEGAVLSYHDIGDYLTTDDKLSILSTSVATGDVITATQWQRVIPNEDGDWINQRSTRFGKHLPISNPDDPTSIFALRTNGLKTNRDSWNYNHSRTSLESTAHRMVANFAKSADDFNRQHPDLSGTAKAKAEKVKNHVNLDPTHFAWDRADYARIAKGQTLEVADGKFYEGQYRPFNKQNVNFARSLNSMIYQLPRLYPEASDRTPTITLTEPSSRVPFSVLIVDHLPDSKIYIDAARCFPLQTFQPEEVRDEEAGLFDEEPKRAQWQSNVTESAIASFRALDPAIGEGDIFYYTYGILHSTDYRTAFAADLKKELPRIPVAEDAKDFWAFAQAGRELADLHLNYENVEAWPDLKTHFSEDFDSNHDSAWRVEKMRYGKKANPENPKKNIDDKTVVEYNDHITITGIPERAHDYVLGSRSALDWVLNQYQIKTHKDSGIINDPNTWGAERGQPTYIYDLLRSVVTVSMRTLDVVDSLPTLDL